MQPKPPQDPNPHRGRRSALHAGIALAAAAFGWPLQATAQLVRPFPDSARLGRLQIHVFPEATLNDEPVRLAAGARIYDQRNLIVTPASLSGTFDVIVERDGAGHIGRAWILTPDEMKAAQARERDRASGRPGDRGR